MSISTQVLVVEDEKLVAADIQTHLETLGYSVPGILSTGEEAIRCASEFRPDLVLMDIHLSGRIDGIETAHILQSRLNIPVIYVTAFADDRTLQRAKATEPYGYVLKPFGRKELQTAIELALHKHVRERRLRSKEQWVMGLMASIGAGIMAIDHDGLVCLMNPYAEECTGTGLTEALGSSWYDLIELLDRRHHTPQCPIRRAIQDNMSSDMTDTPVLFPKLGRRAIVSGAVSPMSEPDSDRRAAILVFREITEWQHLETHFRRTRHLDDMQRLAGGLASQFTNFLTLIAGSSESLAIGIDPGDTRAWDVRTIQDATERAGKLTRELLAFSSGQPIHFEIFDPNRFLAGIVETLQFTLGPALTIEREFDPDAGKIEADPAHLEQVLTALVSNARDASAKGGAITIRTSNFDVDEPLMARFVDLPQGPYVRIDVVDRGEGIGFEKQPQIFQPFFSTRPGTGGLGLATSYGLVKQNRGHIWFESEPGKGTTFSICLPRVDRAAQHVEVPKSLRGTETILLVEENTGARAATRDTLMSLGYRVIEAASAGEAMGICEREPKTIHAVVAGIATPNMEARDLAARLPQLRPGIKLLFLSVYSRYTLQHYGAIDSVAVLLQKPFTATVLAKAVRDVLAS